jgi:hypothetical protein
MGWRADDGGRMLYKEPAGRLSYKLLGVQVLYLDNCKCVSLCLCMCLCVSSRLAGRAADVVSLPEEVDDMKEERRVWNEEQLIAKART